MSVADSIDHTLLAPAATPKDIVRICREARTHNFAAVCINPVYVSLARESLSACAVKVATVVGFPLGAETTYVKAMQTVRAINDGVNEIDMVMAIGLFKGKDYSAVAGDIKEVTRIASGLPVKVIIETGLLTAEEIETASRLVRDNGAAFVKTSTGFGPRGVSMEDMEIIKSVVGDDCAIKASGGIRTAAFSLELIQAGAARLGTSSGVKIMEELAARESAPKDSG